MKKTKLFVAVGMAIAIGSGLTACSSPYNGEGTVISKEIEAEEKKSLMNKETVISYLITVDDPDSDKDQTFDVPKDQYDSIRVGEFVQVKEGNIR